MSLKQALIFLSKTSLDFNQTCRVSMSNFIELSASTVSSQSALRSVGDRTGNKTHVI
jgi:hypothetical protein